MDDTNGYIFILNMSISVRYRDVVRFSYHPEVGGGAFVTGTIGDGLLKARMMARPTILNLGTQAPEKIAVSIVAEMIQVRAGKD